MQTRREALVSAGLAKAGRGKFSKDANRWLDKQRAAGVKFSDDDAPVKAVKVQSVPKPVKEKKVSTAPERVPAPSDTPYLSPDEYRFPEGEYRAVKFVNGRKVEVSLRECCNLCRVSLVNHACDAPTILGDIAVRIEKR